MSLRLPSILAATALSLALAACARDRNDALRASLDRWFDLGRTVYFESRFRCTVAIYHVETAEPRASLPVQMDPQTAKEQFRTGRRAAIRMAGHSPHDVADALLLSGDGAFGKEVLAAAAQAGPCFRGTMAETALFRAMTRRGGTLAYDRDSEGMVLLDPVSLMVFYVAGDVW